MALSSIGLNHAGWRCSRNPTGLGGLHNRGRRLRHVHPPAPPHAPHRTLPHGNSCSKTLSCHASAQGPSSTGIPNLYGSRTAICRQLLQHLLQEAPPPSPETGLPAASHPQTHTTKHKRPHPQAPTAAKASRPAAPGAARKPYGWRRVASSEPPPEALEHVASLVRCVECLMLAHGDMQQLQAAMERCAKLAAAGTGGGSGGGGSGRRIGGGRRVGSFGSTSGSRSKGKGKSKGTGRPVSGGVPRDGIGNDSGQSRSSSGSGSGGASRSSGDGGRLAPRPPWSWSAVQRLVVVGLGSLAAYREEIGSGRRTERESSSALKLLYQLALSRVLASPILLPGLAQSPPVGDAGAPAHLSSNVSYYEPEYRPWDVQLLQRLWASGPPSPASSPHRGEPTSTAGAHTAVPPSAATQPVPPGPGPGPAAAAPSGAASQSVSSGLSAPAADRGGGTGGGIADAPACSAVHVRPSLLAGAELVAHVPTLYYCPFCPRDVYDAIVRANQAAGTLHNVAIMGNSFNGQADNTWLLRAFMLGEGLDWEEEVHMRLVAEGKVVEVTVPEFAAHGVATALHLFL